MTRAPVIEDALRSAAPVEPGVDGAHDRRIARRAAIAVGCAYALILLVIWGSFEMFSGMPGETSFAYTSMTREGWRGFIYTADPLRVYTNAFYHLSYLLSEALGVTGSYVPYQIVYALLWWWRGFLIFLLVRRFCPRCDGAAYLAGALAIVHASDRALEWVGQLNQFGMIFWMLLAFYALTLVVDGRRTGRWVVPLLAACFFEYMSLWSYESQIFLALLFPVVILVGFRQPRQRLRLAFACWYSVPAVYIALTFQKYASAGGRTYQESVMRQSWGVATILNDWWFNIAESLKFWTWANEGWAIPEREGARLALVAAAIFLVGGVVILRLEQRRDRASSLVPPLSTALALVAAGVVFLAFSFPVYLVLEQARALWRTQFLSAIGAALVLTSLIGLAAHALSRTMLKTAAFLAFGAVVAYFGALGAIQKGAHFRAAWEQHRAAMIQLLHVVPNVEAETIVILTNVPRADDAFGDNLWFDMALRLAYPYLNVTGAYFYDDGAPGPGSVLKLEGDRWRWTGPQPFPPGTPVVGMANTLVVNYERQGPWRVLPTFPAALCERCSASDYNPARLIRPHLAASAARRYRLG